MPEILDKINELRQLIRDRYGVEADIDIIAHNIYDPALTRELANYISFELAAMVKPEEIGRYYNTQSEKHQWVTLSTRAGFNFAGHY